MKIETDKVLYYYDLEETEDGKYITVQKNAETHEAIPVKGKALKGIKLKKREGGGFELCVKDGGYKFILQVKRLYHFGEKSDVNIYVSFADDYCILKAGEIIEDRIRDLMLISDSFKDPDNVDIVYLNRRSNVIKFSDNKRSYPSVSDILRTEHDVHLISTDKKFAHVFETIADKTINKLFIACDGEIITHINGSSNCKKAKMLGYYALVTTDDDTTVYDVNSQNIILRTADRINSVVNYSEYLALNFDDYCELISRVDGGGIRQKSFDGAQAVNFTRDLLVLDRQDDCYSVYDCYEGRMVLDYVSVADEKISYERNRERSDDEFEL